MYPIILNTLNWKWTLYKRRKIKNTKTGWVDLGTRVGTNEWILFKDLHFKSSKYMNFLQNDNNNNRFNRRLPDIVTHEVTHFTRTRGRRNGWDS